MENVYFNITSKIAKFITAEGALLFCALVTLILPIVFYIILRKNIALKRRLFYVYLAVSLSLTIFLMAFIYIAFDGFFLAHVIYLALYSSVFIVGVVPFLIVEKRKVKVTNEHKDLIRLIDSEIDKQFDKEPIYEQMRSMRTPFKVEELKVKEKKTKTNTDGECGIDFTHVKNVINKVSNYDLSVSEKKQINELLFYISKAEAGDDEKEIKDSINEGLSAVLKIMAKHSI